MNNLHYATSRNTHHDIRVKTWTENGEIMHEIAVDGRVRSAGSLGPVEDPQGA